MISTTFNRKYNNTTLRYVATIFIVLNISLKYDHVTNDTPSFNTLRNYERRSGNTSRSIKTTIEGANKQKQPAGGATFTTKNNNNSACGNHRHTKSKACRSVKHEFSLANNVKRSRHLDRLKIIRPQNFSQRFGEDTTIISLTGDRLFKQFFSINKYCAHSNNYRRTMEQEPIVNVQSLFRRRGYDVPMLVVTRDNADKFVQPVFGLDDYAKWNENQVIPKYSRSVGKAIVAKILEHQQFDATWLKDDVLKVIRTALKESMEEKEEIADDLSCFSEDRAVLQNEIRILDNALTGVRDQLNVDKTLEIHRYVTLPGNMISFNAMTKTFHWKFANCFYVSACTNRLDHTVVEESINRDIIRNIRNNKTWLVNVLDHGRGFFVDSSDVKRAIILKNSDIPEDRIQTFDLANAITHFEPVDVEAFKTGPITRGNHLSRGYEHQALPEDYEDEESDPDPYDLDSCSRINREDEDYLDCLQHVCAHSCELCREQALNARYYIDNEVTPPSKEGLRLDKKYRLIVVVTKLRIRPTSN